jgi:hypothetical protein
MPRYFFHVDQDGQVQLDDTGTEFATVEEVRGAAMRFLPDLARDELPGDGDRMCLAVTVTDETDRAVYSATLTFDGRWLDR